MSLLDGRRSKAASVGTELLPESQDNVGKIVGCALKTNVEWGKDKIKKTILTLVIKYDKLTINRSYVYTFFGPLLDDLKIILDDENFTESKLDCYDSEREVFEYFINTDVCFDVVHTGKYANPKFKKVTTKSNIPDDSEITHQQYKKLTDKTEGQDSAYVGKFAAAPKVKKSLFDDNEMDDSADM